MDSDLWNWYFKIMFFALVGGGIVIGVAVTLIVWAALAWIF